MDELDRIDVEIGRRIREARARAGLTQRELGDRIGVTFQQVQKYEGGRSRLAVAMLCRVADALQVTPPSLVSGLLGDLAGSSDALSASERELVAAYRALGADRQRAALLALLQAFAPRAGR